MDIFVTMRARVLTALRIIIPNLPDEIAARVEVTPPREAGHGDMATNAAMVSAKFAGRLPRDLATDIAAKLRPEDPVDVVRTVPIDPNDPAKGARRIFEANLDQKMTVTDSSDVTVAIADAAVAGPGFVNIRLDPASLRAVLPAILRTGESFGDSQIGAGERVNVEYVSANPTGPMHIGHCRGAVVGDALANLLAKAGWDVTKEYYINDAGAQVTALAWAAYYRYLQALGTNITEEEFSEEVPGGLQYRGEYLIEVGARLAEMFGPALADQDDDGKAAIAAPLVWLDRVREITIAAMMDSVREDLRLLGVDMDVFTSERAMVATGVVDTVIDRLAADGLIYEGVLEPPKGKTPDDWEPRAQTLFRAEKFGDDVDRPLRKSDGSNTYFANDIAYHADKISRGFTSLVDVWGADHGGYVKRMQAAVKATGGGLARLDVVLCQIVHIVRGGQPVRMSKRAGTYVTLRDLIEEVGADAVRFTMLTRRADAQMEFDLDQVLAQTRENPVFYVQYAHARCRSVLRAAAEQFPAARLVPQALADVPLDDLSSPEELGLIRRLAGWPRTIEAAAVAREAHRIAFYLYDLAGDFHMLWNRGRDDATLRFLQPDNPAATEARLALVAATAIVIRSGFAVMGVTPVEEMR